MNPYRLDDFLPRFDQWVALETPGDDLRIAVLDWIFTRHEHPYGGVRRVEGFDNLWYGAVPGTEHGAGEVVVCSYWVHEADHRVQCESFGTLSMPI